MSVPQPPPIKNWPHTFDNKYVFKRLGIAERPDDQQAVQDLAQEVFDVAAIEADKDGRPVDRLFRSINSRNKILYEWRRRLPRLPAAVSNHVTDSELLTGALYKYLNCVQDDLVKDFDRRQNQPSQPQLAYKTVQKPAQQKKAQQETPETTKHAEEPERSVQNQPEQQKTFDYTRPYIVPNGDVQIIRADHPDMPIAIRMSDFLNDQENPQNICPNGDWVNIANIRFEMFRENLAQEGFLQGGDTIWLHHLSLDQINTALIANPQAGEVRLASFNLASTILRTIREHWPRLRNPSPDPFVGDKRSPLPRPNMTIIIRSKVVRGGALPANQPGIARPTEKMGGNKITPNRHVEQVARYAAERHSKTKRKRAEAEAASGAEGEPEAAPAAQRKRLEAAPGTATVPAAGIAPGPGTVPAIQQPQEVTADDTAMRALLGPEVFEELRSAREENAEQQPQGGNDDDSGFLGLLDVASFNESGVVGDDSAALQAFFEGNEWVGEPMEED
ncbi:hypothetical protein N7453_004920 [Penicillium expansum]|nr:hypothetical protein N7453_004920 [Penicillium expansum]